MKATELRIGNYVDCFGIKTIQSIMITPTGEYKLELNEKRKSGMSFSEMCLINSLDLKPIPLTEERLLKFGFEKEEKSFFIEFGCYSFFIDEYKKGRFIYNSTTAFNYKDILFVHELQNLYHALTGEELTLNK